MFRTELESQDMKYLRKYPAASHCLKRITSRGVYISQSYYKTGQQQLYIVPNYNQQDATFLDLFISTDALHVSGGSSAHHEEHITVHTASGIVNQCCRLLVSWMRWNLQRFLIYLFLPTHYMFQAVPPPIIRST